MRIVELGSRALLILVALAVTVVIASLFAITVTHTSLMTGTVPSGALQYLADLTLRILRISTDHSMRDRYLSSLAAVQNVLIVVATGAFAAAPVLSIFTVLVAWRKRQSVKVHRIRVIGRDDLAIMQKYFKGAEHVTVYSGDFSWVREESTRLPLSARILRPLVTAIRSLLTLLKSPLVKPKPVSPSATRQPANALLRELRRLAPHRKLRMISSKTEAEVKTGMGDQLFDEFRPCLSFSDARGLKCSVVRYGQNSYAFLDKSQAAAPQGREVTVAVYTDARETRNVLATLAKLLEQQ